MATRTENTIRNAKYVTFSRVINLILSFVTRTAFVHILGSTYLGINGLYSELLSSLSFAELGFGSVLNYALYKPVANDNKEKVLKLLSFYKRIYYIKSHLSNSFEPISQRNCY